MYGGRAIDSFDRRILTVYMDEYLGDFIFDTFQPFHFFQNKEVDYKIPIGDVKEKFVGKISQTPKSILQVFSKGSHTPQLLYFHGRLDASCKPSPDRRAPSRQPQS